MWQLLLGTAGAVPILVLVAAIAHHRWKAKSAGSRIPVTEKLLRPPGYTLGRQIDQLSEDFMAWLFIAYLASLAAVGALRYTPPDRTGQFLFLAAFGGIAALFTILAWRKWQEARRRRLGLLGEQAVGEQLQLLASEGYRVFHDIPSNDKWNIDHVLVGPAGVFAIETKCRVKTPTKSGEPDNRAEYNGTAIKFPNWADSKSPEQARRNAKWLTDMLSKAVGEPVKVKPIVALPGWFVPPHDPAFDVRVLSGRMLPYALDEEPRRIPDKLIEQVVYQLDQRCRDVAF